MQRCLIWKDQWNIKLKLCFRHHKTYKIGACVVPDSACLSIKQVYSLPSLLSDTYFLCFNLFALMCLCLMLVHVSECMCLCCRNALNSGYNFICFQYSNVRCFWRLRQNKQTLNFPLYLAWHDHKHSNNNVAATNWDWMKTKCSSILGMK